jgi:hypothetical protein
MKLFDRFFKKKQPKQDAPEVSSKVEKTEKDLATERGEPYVNILSLELDPENMGQGAFELDWNDKFISNLIRAGYKMKDTDTDADLVDRWFQNVCRNVVLETWEQYQAMDPERDRVVKTRNIGDGRTEVS